MEHRAGKLTADVISVGTENVITLKKAGIYARYRSPEAQFYPPEQTDKDGYFHADSLGIATIAYNHQLVKKKRRPRAMPTCSIQNGRVAYRSTWSRSGR